MKEIDKILVDIFQHHSQSIIKDNRISVFSPGTYDLITNEICSIKFPDIRLSNNTIHLTEKPSSMVEINPEYTGQIIADLVNVGIVNFFPSIIKSFIENQIFSDTNLNRALIYLIDFRKRISLLDSLEEVSMICKMWINYFYGRMNSLNMNPNLILGEANKILEHIKSIVGNNWVYIDTDEIYYRYKGMNDFKEIQDYLTHKNIECDINDIQYGIFFAKKKYLIFNDGHLISRSFKFAK